MVMPHQDTQLARGPGRTDFVKVAQGPAASSTPPCSSLRSMTYTLLAVASKVKERGTSQRSHPCRAEYPFGSWEYV